MKIEIEVGSGQEALQRLVASLFGEEDASHVGDCRCVECAATRMAQDTYTGKTPTDEEMVRVVQRRVLKIARQAQRLGEVCHTICVGTVEKPTRPECDDAVYRLRVEQYNSCVRCIQTLWAMLPEERKEMPEGISLPVPLTWEEALARREVVRADIVEAVEVVHRGNTRSVGPELAELLKAALKKGRSREDIAEILQEAVNSISAPRPEEEQPSPPAA